MMSNNTYSNNSSSLNNVTSLAKDEELQKFERSFFPAGGAPQLANIPQAPPAPRNFSNVKSKPINLKTRNWGPQLENGFQGLNRSLYDRPNVFNWDNKPILGERTHLNNNNNVLSSFPSSSSSTSTTSTSRSVVDNIPPAIAAPLFRDLHNDHIRGRRLRIRNWGYPSAEGWSSMNRDLYNAGMRLERDVLLNELRYKYGPRPNFQQQERSIATETMNFVENVPTTQTTLVETGPTKVLATTVPVPMLNPPINDGRRYAKLYKRNTNAYASEKGVSKLVKRRGTRRDHLVQPNTAAPMTSIVTGAPASYSVVQPATLVSETRSVLPATGIAPYTAVAPLTTFAPTPALSKAELKREKRANRQQQKFVKKEQRAERKALKKNKTVLPGPMFSTAPVATLLPATTTVGPAFQSAAMPTTTVVGSPALQNATFVGETRSVLTQEATFLAPTTTTTVMPLTTGTISTPVGLSAQPLDHAHVLAGQLGNAPVKRPRRARKAKKGTEQPLYSNIISTTPAPLTAITTQSAATTTSYTTSSSLVEGTTVVQPATLVGETRNIVVDPLAQQQAGMIKQEFYAAPAIAPLAIGNPMM